MIWAWLSLAVSAVTAARGMVHFPQMRNPSNISSILDQLLDGYDSMLRPDHGRQTTIIKTDMNIRSMGPISEADMAYSMDAYFRQTWKDSRLTFSGPMKEMAVHIKMLEKLWKPDTFFYNGRSSYLHTITTPNKLLRIKQDGTVLYSMRLTIKANCPMYLQYFPVDEQHCPLQFGSFSYTNDQLNYIWKHGAAGSIKISKDMRLSQFDLIGHPANNVTVRDRGGQSTGEFSTLSVNFVLQRHMGYFLIQVYVPCTLIVVLSWVSFWLNREATADRVGLGITTVLTLTTLSLDTSSTLPKVPYATALDWFIIMCYGFVIASLLEFAGVHYFTKNGSGEIEHSESDSETEELTNYHDDIKESKYGHYHNNANHKDNSVGGHVNCKKPHASPPVKKPCLMEFIHCLQGHYGYRNSLISRAKKSGVNSVSMIDKVSRVLFPLSFTGLMCLYWTSYMRQ